MLGGQVSRTILCRGLHTGAVDDGGDRLLQALVAEQKHFENLLKKKGKQKVGSFVKCEKEGYDVPMT
jgi:hypothetical protein